jgi:hypothetical protein
MNDTHDKALETPRAGDVEVDVPEEGILRVTYRGFITGPVVERSLAPTRERLARSPARVVFFDTLGMEGFDASVRGPGADLLRFLKGSKLDAGVVAASSTAVRLIGTALGITARFPMAFVKTSEEAMAHAREVVRAGGHG